MYFGWYYLRDVETNLRQWINHTTSGSLWNISFANSIKILTLLSAIIINILGQAGRDNSKIV